MAGDHISVSTTRKASLSPGVLLLLLPFPALVEKGGGGGGGGGGLLGPPLAAAAAAAMVFKRRKRNKLSSRGTLLPALLILDRPLALDVFFVGAIASAVESWR